MRDLQELQESEQQGEILRVMKAKSYIKARHEVIESAIAITDRYEIFRVPENLEVEPEELLYSSLTKDEAMRKTTKSEEYMYYLGHATAIASLDVLLSDLPQDKQRQFIDDWTGLMKKSYAETNLWTAALNNLHNKQTNKGETDGVHC